MTFAACSGVKFRPMASTKSPSGSAPRGNSVSKFSTDEIAELTHEIEIYAMIHQIILTWLHIWWCREIYPVFLTYWFGIFVRSTQAYYVWMELFEVLPDYRWRVPSRVASDKHRAQNISATLLDKVDHDGHFVQFFRTYVRAVREAEIHLWSSKSLLVMDLRNEGFNGPESIPP